MSEPSPLFLEDGPDCLYPTGGVTAWWSRPAVVDRARAEVGIVVLPIQGGDYDVSKHFAGALAEAGFHTLRFERRAEWLEAERPLDELELLLRQYRADVKEGMSRWLASPEGPARLGMFGVSMGAGVGAAVAGTDERIEASVLCIGGSGLADVLMETRDTEVRAYRDALARRLGLGLPELSAVLHQHLDPLDPHHDAAGMDAARTLFIAARFDRVIRWRQSVALWEAIGRPRRVTLPTGHYSAALCVPWIRRLARRFFDAQLAQGAALDAPGSQNRVRSTSTTIR